MYKIFLLICTLSVVNSITAQKGVVVDKIAAVIGDKIILQSDIKNRIDDMKRSGSELPNNIQCLMLETMLSTKVLAQQAIKDSLPVSDEDIEAQLDLKIRQFVQQFGTVEALEQVAGKTVFQLKEDSREQVREQKLAEEMQKEIMRTVKITPTEVKKYYDAIPKDSLNFYESQVEVGQIVITPKATRDIVQLVKDDLNDFRERVIKGEKKFEILAKTYSQDPGSKDDGGLFTFKKSENNVDQDFKIASLKLKNPGDVSKVVKSQFGYHIIQLVKKDGDDITVRHILNIPDVSESEFTKAINKLDTIRSSLIVGNTKFNEAVAKYSDDEYSKFTGGMIINPEDQSTFLTIDRFPDKDLVLMLKSLKLNEYSKPVVFTDQRGRKAVRIVYLKTQLAPHTENLKDDYSKIAARSLEEKKGEIMEKWMNKKLPTYYINVDGEFNTCETIQKWVVESAKIK
jgi:peptidyl-prolyl cis-trans isomerase SurA